MKGKVKNMSLQFIAGSGSGKTRYLYEKVIKESEEHPDIQYLFIVPEQYTATDPERAGALASQTRPFKY